jgi:DHA1 family inner membrane transport protein
MPGETRQAPRRPAPPPADRGGPGAGHVLLVAFATVVAAIVLGVVGRAAAGAGLIAHAGPVAEPVSKLGPWIIALGAPWLAVAWILGAISRRVVLGAMAGALALVGGTGAWYAFTLWQVGRAALDYTVPVAFAWGIAALGAGAVFGAAGAIWRSGGTDLTRALGVSILAGCLIGEAILLLAQWDGRAARAVLAAELFAGLALPVLLLARRPRALLLAIAFTFVLALAAAAGESYVRDALRDVGWGGR